MVISCAYRHYSQCSMHYVNDLSKSMEFANHKIENLKKNDKENKVKIKKPWGQNIVPRGVQQARKPKILRFSRICWWSWDTHEVVGKFLSDELEMENAADIEFQRAHRIGKKKTGAKLDWWLFVFWAFQNVSWFLEECASWRMISILRSTRIFLKK